MNTTKAEAIEITTEVRIAALAKHLECAEDEIGECGYDDCTFDGPGASEYRVMTDAEADQAWDESLDSYIDDCILGELKNETLKNYFDREAWKRDARHDGRGHSLSSYDGEENEVRLDDGQYLYIYRHN
jgi:hypothetical protein